MGSTPTGIVRFRGYQWFHVAPLAHEESRVVDHVRDHLREPPRDVHLLSMKSRALGGPTNQAEPPPSRESVQSDNVIDRRGGIHGDHVENMS